MRASRVCSKWHKVSQDASLWTHLDLSQGRLKEKYRNDKKLEWFLRKYPSAIEVKIGGWKNTATTTTLKLVSQLCPNLVIIFSAKSKAFFRIRVFFIADCLHCSGIFWVVRLLEAYKRRHESDSRQFPEVGKN